MTNLVQQEFTQDRVISLEDELAYIVRFENMSSATAPVQELVVVDYSNSRIFTGQLSNLSDILYGDRLINVPSNATNVSIRDFPEPSQTVGETDGDMAIDITTSLDPQTGRVEWKLKAIDTATGLATGRSICRLLASGKRYWSRPGSSVFLCKIEV